MNMTGARAPSSTSTASYIRKPRNECSKYFWKAIIYDAMVLNG
jgi:hypothetical protein